LKINFPRILAHVIFTVTLSAGSAIALAADSAPGDLSDTLIKNSGIMCSKYAPEAAKDVVSAVRKAAGEDNFAIFVRNKYTLCPIGRLTGKAKAVWYARYGAIGYDRDATPDAVAKAVSVPINEFAKKKQGPDGNASYDAGGKLLSGQVVPMFEPACHKLFRECY
jgi:hypothetical protein